MKITPKQYALLLLDLKKEELGDDELKSRIERVGKIVLKNKDNAKMLRIEQVYLGLKNKQGGLLDAEVITTQELSDAHLEQIREAIAKKHNLKKENISISVAIDKNLKGGIVVRAANEIIDASLRSKINQIKKALL